jgi:hypothetical protein
MYGELVQRLETLDKTATSWYDHTPESVERRSQETFSLSGMCARYSALVDDDVEKGELMVLASDLKDQGRILADLAAELKVAKQEESITDTELRSHTDLPDESRTGSVNRTDWNIFLAVEPRYFLADNASAVDDPQEIRVRAYNFARSSVSGNGLSTSQKKRIVGEFLARVENERQNQVR